MEYNPANINEFTEEIRKGLESSDPKEQELAQHRFGFLKKMAHLLEGLRNTSFEIDLEELSEKLTNGHLYHNKGIISPESILDWEVVYTAEEVPTIDKKEQLQQVGIDLRLAKASRVIGNATLAIDKSQTEKPSFVEMQLVNNFYLFKAGELYSLDFMEDVRVPEGMAGFVKHRSTINRSIGTIESGWYDSGFESSGGCGAVFRPDTDVKIEVGYRVAQIVFFHADNANSYEGQYQKS